MTIRQLIIYLSMICIVGLNDGPAAAGPEVPEAHPEKLGRGNPTCTDCHDPDAENSSYKRFNHSPFFMEHHRGPAQRTEVCAMCHRESFCTDCHVTEGELKPSLKNRAGTYRRNPHRGDYLARHRIDGRLNPAPCFKCHGNPKSAARCARCHG